MSIVGDPVILDGRTVSARIRCELATRAEALKRRGAPVSLGIVLVGDDGPSQIYVRNKARAGAQVGVDVLISRLPATATQQEIEARVQDLDSDRSVSGVIIQLPLPRGIDVRAVLDRVSPSKDVDGLTTTSLGCLVEGRPSFIPATPAGIVALLGHYTIRIPGRRVVVVGRGLLVGKTLANLLLLKGDSADATVTVAHSATSDLADACRQADILVTAAGRPNLIDGHMLRPGVVVVDAGTTRTERGLVGDVDFESARVVAGAITPVPGGVGPMTVAMLLSNVVAASERQSPIRVDA